ncbi:MAG: TatD family hydrolase [Cytophagales bacterium]|nr:TatD family hydrolase [Cytophagales bacterium]
MKFIDTHAHIYQDDFDPDLMDLVDRTLEAGIYKVVLPNVDIESLAPMKNRNEQYPELFKMAVGLHPCYVKEDYENQLKQLWEAANQWPIAAIGEIGLDYHWDLTFKKEQHQALEIQLDWAKKLNKPVLLHCRESMSDVIQLVKPFASQGVSGIFHCFSGTLEEAEEIIDMGFYLGIGGTLTYKKSELPRILQKVGIKRVVLETDSPYLSPVPNRGKRNEPAWVALVASKLAEIMDLSLEEISSITTQNANEVFQNTL